MKRTPLKRTTPLKRGPWNRGPRPRRKPRAGRSRKYLDWIRSLPCTVAGCTDPAQAAHTGAHGMAIKAADTSAIPLCAKHHLWEFPASLHRLGPRSFESLYDIRLEAIVARLQEAFNA